MGKLTAAVAALTFVMAVATVRLSAQWWTIALYATLVLGTLTLLLVLGWLASRVLPSNGKEPHWALVPASAGLLAVALSYLNLVGPGGLPYSEQATVDFPLWLASAAGLAGALSSMGYGARLTLSTRWFHVAGLFFVTIGVLSLQPALKARELPYLGPVGSAIVLATIVATALLALRRD